jgi:hypothetical protein
MPPFSDAAAVYDREPCARSFEHDLYLHFLHDTVLSTPEVFVMLRPVCRDWPVEWLHDPQRTDPNGDAWWIWLLAGDAAPVWALHPPKPWVGFERDNLPRFHRYVRLRRFYQQ